MLNPDLSYVEEDFLYQEIGKLIDYPIASTVTYWKKVTSGYGHRVLDNIDANFHSGLDIGVASGTAVYAPFDGEVIDKGSGGDRGRYISISGNISYNGNTYQIIVCFYHFCDNVAEYLQYSIGDTVSRGDIVGRSGRSGVTETSYKAHLHMTFATQYANGYVNSIYTIDPVRIYGDFEWEQTSDTDSIPEVTE